MTNRTPIQAITGNFIKDYSGRADVSSIHLEGALADGSTFDNAITGEQASELIADLYEALTHHDEHFNVGAAFDMDRGAA